MKPDHESPQSSLRGRLVRGLEAQEIDLPAPICDQLVIVVDRLLSQGQNLTAIRAPLDAVDRHLLDSLMALRVPEVRSASHLIDIGSGGGFPGLPLAAALPQTRVTLVESERKKALWLQSWLAEFPNLEVVADRSEHLAGERRERWDLACVRAVATPAAALELAAPLVAVGGHAILWRSADADPTLDRDAHAAAEILGFERMTPLAVTPFADARRILDRYRKVAASPARFPRRPGRATKRPLGATTS